MPGPSGGRKGFVVSTLRCSSAVYLYIGLLLRRCSVPFSGDGFLMISSVFPVVHG